MRPDSLSTEMINSALAALGVPARGVGLRYARPLAREALHARAATVACAGLSPDPDSGQLYRPARPD